MHILTLSHLYPPVRIGGMEKIVQCGVESLVERGHHVSIVTGNYKQLPRPPGKSTLNQVDVYAGELLDIEYPNQFITEHLYANFKMIELAMALINKKQVDWIHAHDWFTAPAAETLHKMTGIPLVSTIHYSKYHEQQGRETPKGNFIVELQKQLMTVSDKITVYSKKMIDNVKEILGPDTECSYFPIGMDARIPQFDLKQFKERPNRVVVIGRLAKEKNFSLVLRAASIVQKKYPDLTVDLIGDGALYEDLKGLADELKVNTHFHGFIESFEEIKRVLRQSKAMILPSYYDSFGLVVLESLQTQTPVLISNQVGAKEISSGIQDYIFSPDDSVALAEKMEKVLETDQVLATHMHQIRIDVNHKYTRENMAVYLERIFNIQERSIL